MTTREFSDEFDVLLNSYSLSAHQGPTELDEYEKSVLLTEAQEMIVRELYSGGLATDSFESSEALRRDLEALVKTDKPEKTNGTAISSNSTFFKLKPDVWFITYESIDLADPYCPNSPSVKIVPMKQDEWHNVKNNPFRGPSRRRAIRLDCGDNKVEIISIAPVKNYIVRYLKKPNPIILADLDGLSINNKSTVTECELNTALHRTILERAVLLASRRIGKKE